MAMSVTFTNFGGRVVHENRGGVERDYVRDPLGNTVALVDMSGNVTDTYSYWPYGETRVHQGSATTQLTFLGTLGYFLDYSVKSYVRARHLRADLTRWMTVDPLWPKEQSYGYVGNSPGMFSDAFGLSGSCSPNDCASNKTAAGGCIALMCSIVAGYNTLSGLKELPDCWRDVVKRLQKEYDNKDNNFNPSPCCKKANSGGFPDPTNLKDDLIALLIGAICNGSQSKCPSPSLCSSITKNYDSCASCCETTYPKGSALDSACKNRCTLKF